MDDLETKLSTKEVLSLSKPEEKAEKAVDLMAKALSQPKAPDFKVFWEAQKICREIFKGEVNMHVRRDLWQRYSELIDQAHGLKKRIEEESQFTVQQIGKVLDVIEADLAREDAKIVWSKEREFPKSFALEGNRRQYLQIQGILEDLHSKAARIGALRKEISQAEIIPKQKYRLFKRLSKIGDLVFPVRRERILKLSRMFLDDVKAFLQVKKTARSLKSEIKMLQKAAKMLYLNTEAFQETREMLSSAWNRVIEEEKIQDQAFAKRREEMQPKVDALKRAAKEVQTKMSDPNQAEIQIGKIIEEMEKLALPREDKKCFRQEMQEVFKDISQSKEEKKHQEKVRREKVASQRNLCHQNLKQKIDEIERKQQEGAFSRELLDAFQKELDESVLQDQDREVLELRFAICDDADLLQRASEDESVLDRLQVNVKEAEKRCEALRKAKGASGLDFSLAMQLDWLHSEHKKRLHILSEKMRELK